LREDLSLRSGTRGLQIPWRILEREAEDRGSYIVILKLPREASVGIGNLGFIRFPEGYYLFISSARRNLSQRLQRHRGILKRHFRHVDYLRAIAEFHFALPIPTEDLVECQIPQAIRDLAG
jgi:sugar fermentation stimulation protein A